jgi:hypothetical protein
MGNQLFNLFGATYMAHASFAEVFAVVGQHVRSRAHHIHCVEANRSQDAVDRHGGVSGRDPQSFEKGDNARSDGKCVHASASRCVPFSAKLLSSSLGGRHFLLAGLIPRCRAIPSCNRPEVTRLVLLLPCIELIVLSVVYVVILRMRYLHPRKSTHTLTSKGRCYES